MNMIRPDKLLNNLPPPNWTMYIMDNSQGRKHLKKLLNIWRKSPISLVIRDMGIKGTLACNFSRNRLLEIQRFADSFGQTVEGVPSHTLVMIMQDGPIPWGIIRQFLQKL